MTKYKEYVMNAPVAEIVADYYFAYSRKLQYRKETCFLIELYSTFETLGGFWCIHYI